MLSSGRMVDDATEPTPPLPPDGPVTAGRRATGGAPLARGSVALGALTVVLDAALAGVVVGLADLAVIAVRGGVAPAALPVTALVVVGLGVAAVTVIGAPAVLVLRGLGRHPGLRALAGAIREGGAARVEALMRAAIWLTALGLAGAIGYEVTRRAAATFKHGAAAALLSSAATLLAVAAAIYAATWAAPLGRALGDRAGIRRLLGGRAVLAVAAGALVLALAAAHLVLAGIAPLWDPTPGYLGLLAAALLVVAAAARPAARLSRRARGGAAVACGLIAIGALAAVGSAPRVRRAVIAQSEVSLVALRQLHALADADGDGFADRFGGADCDDDDPAVHPGAPERPDDGRDDNCVGGDVAASALAHRRVERPSARPDAPRRDILLVTIDAVRADHSSAYGYHRRTTPTLEELAARGTRFERAEAPSTVTRWSLPALLFGRHPTSLGVRLERGIRRPDPEGLPSLASALAAAGYETGAVLALRGMVGEGDLVGFATVDAVGVPSASQEHPDNAVAVTDRAIRWLRARPADRPSFLWIHYIDPHGTYRQPPGAPVYGDGPADRYDAEIAHVDAQLGRLLRAVSDARRRKGTIVAVTGDHGESFGEHGTRSHGKSLYEDQSHVPLVIAIPGGAARTAAGPVGLVDLAPTLLDLVGLPTPAGSSGVSLAGVVRDGDRIPDHPVVSQLVRDRRVPRDLVALHRGDLVLVRDLEVDTVELYDLARDPAQEDELGDVPAAHDLRRELDRLADTDLSPLPARMP